MKTKKILSLAKLLDLGYKLEIGEKFNDLIFEGYVNLQTGVTSLRGSDAINAGYDELGRKFENIAKFKNSKNQRIECSLNAISKLVELEVTLV